MTVMFRLMVALCAPLLLTGCFLSPGKFVSTLDIRADRSFTFTYVGQVIAFDSDSAIPSELTPESEPGKDGDTASPGDAVYRPVAFQENSPSSGDFSAKESRESKDAKMRAMAEALAKEHGYHSVRYAGNNVFDIDYAITGRLNHGFVYPFNIDAEIVFPFIAIELRGTDRLRVKAPGYANGEAKNQGGMGGAMGMGGGTRKMDEALDGTFTLTTNAEIISQNQEDGAKPHASGKSVTWKVNAMTKDAPTAVLRVAAVAR